ncbi:MAG TPA: zf-HC2 domain-containing protein [Candidatus Acidoferrum sp.]|nr:zf-HC2 domain-containing protein [Candidatus Acidoferrum sp.]
MKCTKVWEEISDYLDSGIDPVIRAEIEQHLLKCEKCRVVVDTTKKTIDIFCNSEPAPIPEDTRHRLYQALERKYKSCRP